MDLIVDANILFAALIKDGLTSNLIFVDRINLYAPEYLLDEFEEYRKVILKRLIDHRGNSTRYYRKYPLASISCQ